MTAPLLEVGVRVRLTARMVNPDSDRIPVEDLPVGSEGTVVHVSCGGSPEDHVANVSWDCGRRLAILPHVDKFEILKPTEKTPTQIP